MRKEIYKIEKADNGFVISYNASALGPQKKVFFLLKELLDFIELYFK